MTCVLSFQIASRRNNVGVSERYSFQSSSFIVPGVNAHSSKFRSISRVNQPGAGSAGSGQGGDGTAAARKLQGHWPER